MKTTILSVFALLISNLISAQEYNGYYIATTGDTIRGKVQVPKGNVTLISPASISMGRATRKGKDLLESETLNESKKINYSKLTFDFKFSEGDGKFKKIDRLKVKGFGFTYEGRPYDFLTWDITLSKQLYPQGDGEVEPNGVYFVLRSVHGAWPVYSLFQDINLISQTWDNPLGRPTNTSGRVEENMGTVTIRDIVFEHPTKGFIFIEFRRPTFMKFNKVLEYLELEDEFLKTLDKKDKMLDVVLKYNLWKEKQ